MKCGNQSSLEWQWDNFCWNIKKKKRKIILAFAAWNVIKTKPDVTFIFKVVNSSSQWQCIITYSKINSMIMLEVGLIAKKGKT